MTSKKLQDVYDEYGSKLIDTKQVSKLELRGYREQLSKIELARVFMAAVNPKRLVAAVAEMATSGNYFESSDGRLFTTVEAYQRLQEKVEAVSPSKLPRTIEEKAESATADAIRQATDYMGQIRSLGLKPAF